MRPSAISRSSVSRATSRRTPSKLESTTADGVSSMITSTPVSFSSARMLRPSRPMIRPFISSLGSSTSRVVRLARVRRGQPLHRDREDAAGTALGLALRLLLDLPQAQPGLVAGLLLDLGDEQLLRLGGAEARDPLELAPLDPLGLLQLLDLLLEVALAVVERLRPALQVGALHLERLGVAKRPLLHPRDLLAAGLELVGRRAVGAGGSGRARRRRPPRCRRHGNQGRVSPSVPLPGRGRFVRLLAPALVCATPAAPACRRHVSGRDASPARRARGARARDVRRGESA